MLLSLDKFIIYEQNNINNNINCVKQNMAVMQLLGKFGNAKTFSNKNVFLFSKRNVSELKSLVAKKITVEQEKIQKFRETDGAKIVGQISVNQIYGGMRQMLSMICETSVLDPNEGISFRGLSIPECRKVLPTAEGGSEPLPEGMFWLLLTGEVPNQAQVTSLSAALCERAALPTHVGDMIRSFPPTMHPMTQFTAAMTTLNTESLFDKKYREGLKKTQFWEYVFEDALNLVAMLPVVAAKVFTNTYKDSKGTTVMDSKKDWSANLATMMGITNPLFVDFLRLYLTCQSDHEGGNVSAHAVHLVGSALSDPYLSFAAGMNGLAGPIHGQANVQVLLFLQKLMKDLGNTPTNDQLKTYCDNLLKSGLVVPGFGHAVLRVTDPRYVAQAEFAKKHFPNDPMFKITQQLLEIVPPILKATGKVQNPWPNVDANSGVCFQNLGLKEVNFYIVLFGASRALGTMASLVWSRALGFPIERPKSISTEDLMKLAKSV